MSEQELKAAKFEIVEQYNNLKQRIGIVESKLRRLGPSVKDTGQYLGISGRLPAGGKVAELPFSEVTTLLEELDRLDGLFALARKEMENTGIQAF